MPGVREGEELAGRMVSAGVRFPGAPSRNKAGRRIRRLGYE
jgi:hypothetical protein